MEWNVERVNMVSDGNRGGKRKWGGRRQQPGGFADALAKAAGLREGRAGDAFSPSYRQAGAEGAAHTLGRYVMMVNGRLSVWAGRL